MKRPVFYYKSAKKFCLATHLGSMAKRTGSMSTVGRLTVFNKTLRLLKSDLKIFVSRVRGDFFITGSAYVAGEGTLYISNAIINILLLALSNHLHSAIWQIADMAGQSITISYIKSSKPKANALNSTRKHYMLGGLTHFVERPYFTLTSHVQHLYFNLKQSPLQLNRLRLSNRSSSKSTGL